MSIPLLTDFRKALRHIAGYKLQVIDTLNVLPIPTAYVSNKRVLWKQTKIVVDFWPRLVPRVTEVLCDRIIDVLDMLRFNLIWVLYVHMICHRSHFGFDFLLFSVLSFIDNSECETDVGLTKECSVSRLVQSRL